MAQEHVQPPPLPPPLPRVVHALLDGHNRNVGGL